ncbi:MAG TPA: hypothetical protein VMG10_18415 [Gemmataceae bacterium]|nr:hypothetical protein [Gemmataceae bacterium]
MKSAQWTAVLVLALMVGGISFISVYLGGGNRGGADVPADTQPALTFPVKIFPREGEKMQTTEVRQSGYQDFWFANDSGNDVTVGLNGKGCTCSEVEITVAPASWHPYLIRLAGMSALQGQPRDLSNVVTLLATWKRELQALAMLESEETSRMLTLDSYLVVPAGAIGRVRLSWHQEQIRQLNTYADLWMGQRGGTANARLVANVVIAAPIEVAKELTIPPVYERDLDKKPEGQRASIVCFSVTRPTFDIKAELLHERIKPESDPVEVGEPIPLKPEDLPRLENDAAKTMLNAKSGYRIPVTVRSRARDGTPIEWGYFRRTVRLSSSDASIEPVQITIAGEVRGDIEVGGDKFAGMINLGPFPQSRGAHGSIKLQSDEKGIELKLDAARKPEYLNAALGKPEETGSGVRLWVLRVEVPPGAARGEFPRADNPVYRDSAIYVKTRVVGKNQTSERSIRIPVLGVANVD